MSTRKTSQTVPIVPAYTVKAAADEIGVSTATIYGWLADGTLDEMRLAAGRIRLVSQDSVLRQKAERQVAA